MPSSRPVESTCFWEICKEQQSCLGAVAAWVSHQPGVKRIAMTIATLTAIAVYG